MLDSRTKFSLAMVVANKKNKMQLGIYVFSCKECGWEFATPSLDVAGVVMDVHDNLKHQPANLAQRANQ